MTIKKRLARSNIAMLVIPILTAAALALLGIGAVLVLLRGNLVTLHDAMEQIEDVLHGFKLTLVIFAAVAAVLLLAAAALTNLYLTRNLFRHIAQPLETLTAGVALSIRVIRTALQKHRAAMIWFILGLMPGSLYAIIMGPASLQTPQPPLDAATFRPLAFLLGAGLLAGLELLRCHMERRAAAV